MPEPYIYTQRIGYADVDRMGFIHHARYLVYMESARTELLRSVGQSYAEWEAAGILLPLTHAKVDFKRPGRYDDIIAVETRVLAATRLRLSFAYEVRCPARSEHLVSGETHHAFMNAEGRPTRIDKDRLTLLESLIPTV